jgi:hypothetical protein
LKKVVAADPPSSHVKSIKEAGQLKVKMNKVENKNKPLLTSVTKPP